MQQFDSPRKTSSVAPKPPHNLEAEQGLLGALLFTNDCFERLPSLTPGMFYDPVHGRIFAVIAEMIRAGRRVDGVVLKERFAADGGLEEIGGAKYLMRLMDGAAVDMLYAATYAEEIRDSSLRREVLATCERTSRAALEGGDVIEMVRQGERELSALMVGGKSYITVREAGEEIVRGLESPAPRGLRTGLAKLDKLLGGGLYAPDLVILAGRPAMGKTALADNIAANVASGDKVVGFFSMEMAPEQIAARVLSRRSIGRGGFSYSQMRSFECRPEAEDVAPLVSNLPHTLLIDPTGAQTLAGLEASARHMKRQTRKLDLILVDYLQLMRDAQARRDGRTQELSEITAGLKALAKRLGVPIIALSQLSRAVESREDKRPQLSDLRESGSIEQDADVVLFVYREHYYLERFEPKARDKESKEEFSARRGQHERRLEETANTFELFTGKNRHGPGGREELYCDLAMDEIADDWPIHNLRTPRASERGQDGAS